MFAIGLILAGSAFFIANVVDDLSNAASIVLGLSLFSGIGLMFASVVTLAFRYLH